MQTVLTEISKGEVSTLVEKTYTYEEAFQKSLEYFNGEELAAKVFVDKYAVRDNDGRYLELTPDDMHDRLAAEFARIDSENYGLNYSERFKIYRDAMHNFARIVPQGSPMAAIGNRYQTMSASNCVVVQSPADSIGGIFETAAELAQLYKRRAGVGLDLSTLRPDGMRVNNAARTTTGAWSFADFYSNVTRMIGMSGRRGALMLTLDVHHPDVVKFVTMKHDLTKVTGANISIRLSDEFMSAVDNDCDYEQRWPCDGGVPKISKMVSARDIWKIIIESATNTAEPGLIFWDHMTKNLPANYYPDFKSQSTNPCSEICLSAFDSCRLISINLTGYVKNPFTADAFFDYEFFKSDICTASQMIDNLVDIELQLISRIQDMCEAGAEKMLWQKLFAAGKNGRRAGLGTHGLGDTLAQLCIKYDSDLAKQTIDTIYCALRDCAYRNSIELAKQRGPFPVFDWELEKDCPFIQNLPPDIKEDMAKYGRRNIALLTQAPTGSVSILSKVGSFNRFNVSSGIEPVFRNYYIRRKKINPDDKNSRVDFTDQVGDQWQEFTVYHNNVQNFFDMVNNKFGISLSSGVTKLPEYFVTSDQVDWQKRVELQGIEQQYLDHSISSTINLPKGTPSEVVGELYLSAWKSGLKGVTVYVDGCRSGVLVVDGNNEEQTKQSGFQDRSAPTRPSKLESDTHKIKVDFGDSVPRNAYVTISFFPGTRRPYELFVVAPHQGLDEKDLQILELTARNTSMNLRHGVPLRYICEQLDKIGGQYIFSIPTNIAKLLRQYDTSLNTAELDMPKTDWEPIAEYEEAKSTPTNGNGKHTSSGLAKCPSCNKRTYLLSGGCGVCVDLDCAYSGCH